MRHTQHSRARTCYSLVPASAVTPDLRWYCDVCAVAAQSGPHLAGALTAHAAREGAEIQGAVDAANGHRRRHGLPWLTLVEIDIGSATGSEGWAAAPTLCPQVSAGSCPTWGGAAGV